MPFIDLTAPSRWDIWGQSLGGGLSRGLLLALQRQLEEQARREQLKREYQDITSLAEALSKGQGLSGILQEYQPQSRLGISLLSNLLTAKTQPAKVHVVPPGGVVVDENGNIVYANTEGVRKPITLKPGEIIVDPATGRVLAQNPKTPPPMTPYQQKQLELLEKRINLERKKLEQSKGKTDDTWRVNALLKFRSQVVQQIRSLMEQSQLRPDKKGFDSKIERLQKILNKIDKTLSKYGVAPEDIEEQATEALFEFDPTTGELVPAR